MAIVSVCNLKGGVGKSTMTIFLASALGGSGKKVLVLDTDGQKSISSVWQTEDSPDLTPLFDIEVVAPRYVFDTLKMKADKYDIVFIDPPRSTEDKTDTALAQIVAMCDTILIPVLPSKVDILATLEFLKIVNEVKSWKTENDLPFKFAAFLNKAKRRAENDLTKQVLQENGLPFLGADLPDLKMFLYPSCFNSILDTPEGHRFENLFTEVTGLIYE